MTPAYGSTPIFYNKLDSKFTTNKVRRINDCVVKKSDSSKKEVEWYNKALEIGLKRKDAELIYKPLVNLGDLYYKMGDSKKAIEFITRSREICEKTGNKVGLAAAANNISKAYILDKQYDKAIIAQEEAIRVATEIQSLPLLRNSYGLSSEIYELAGKHDKALFYHKLYKKIEDSLADKNSRQNHSR